jgi:glyoxylase-like metal-dependent hydrolase (beta-lactamase superfamily II)
VSTPRYEVEILVEGYARLLPDGGWIATSTCALISSPDGGRIVVDPGCNRELLLAGLAERGLRVEDVSVVFLTHHHLDHSMNVALFPGAVVVDHEAVYHGERAAPVGSTIPGTAIEILATPGHADGHASLVVPTGEGMVVVAGDVFWSADGEEPTLDVDRTDEFARDMARLRESRRRLLQVADWIVPGHGRRLPV